MSNMSYCRFQNTLGDLEDCKYAMEDKSFEDLSKDEQRAARKLIELCREIVDLADDWCPEG